MAKASQSWKVLERKVAKYFNTERRKRGADFSISDVEIIVDISKWLESSKYNGFIIGECKYRSNAMGIIDKFVTSKSKDKISIGLVGDNIIMVSLDNFKEVFLEMINSKYFYIKDVNKFHVFTVKKNTPKYVNEYLDQASEYSETLIQKNTIPFNGPVPCLPLLCASKRGRNGIYALFRIEDFQSFLQT